MERTGLTGYLAPEGFEAQLERELKGVTARHGRLFLAKGPAQPVFWTDNVWHDCVILRPKSIGDAAKQLRAIQRNWWPYEFQLHRRTLLLQEQLPHVAAKPLTFPEPAPAAPLGSYTLLDPNVILAAATCDSPFPNGEARFAEFKEGPPSRAYLKLFEGFTRLGRLPRAGETCLELGASPGGWTWVLARLGASVTAYDRAPLDPAVAAMPGVTAVKGDAFAAKPDKVGPVDWLLSDVICYPDKLLEHVKLWLDSGKARNFFCTIKFQGDAHYHVAAEFAAIPGSKVVHLHVNKHELTWALIR